MIKESILKWMEIVVGKYIRRYESLEFDENDIKQYFSNQVMYSSKIMLFMKVHDTICDIEENPDDENDDERIRDEMLSIVQKERDILTALSKSDLSVKYFREIFIAIFALRNIRSKILSFNKNEDEL